jgi:hypothetical protein
MRTFRLIAILVAVLGFCSLAQAKRDPIEAFKKAVERCTLNQRGTRSFHLRAVIEPSYPYYSRQGRRSGVVEIWWVSPTEWRQEVRSPGFHQITIVNYGAEWQKTEGSYYPEWLRETAVALIEPIPHLDQVLNKLREAEVTSERGMIQFSWTITSTDGTVESEVGAGLGINTSTDLIAFGGGLGWDGEFLDYDNFHGRMVARVVHVGEPEVTATVMKLEELKDVAPGFFDVEKKGGDTQLLRTVVVDETRLRENLLPMQPVEWPPVKDGPLEGIASAQVAVDRNGSVREVTSIVVANPALKDSTARAIAKMQFKPYLQDGVPVQVVARITLPFKTVRPSPPEKFESPSMYFERARNLSFPPTVAGAPCILRARFQMKTAAGNGEEGHYVNTWISANQWRQEATIGASRYILTQSGEQRYELAEGPDEKLLRLVFALMVPIPEPDAIAGPHWRIKRETVDEVSTIRLLAGTEHPDGTPDNAVGFWFDANGRLVRTYFEGIDARRSEFEYFSGVEIADHIRVTYKDTLASSIRVTQMLRAVEPLPSIFELPGHELVRKASTEVR